MTDTAKAALLILGCAIVPFLVTLHLVAPHIM